MKPRTGPSRSSFFIPSFRCSTSHPAKRLAFKNTGFHCMQNDCAGAQLTEVSRSSNSSTHEKGSGAKYIVPPCCWADAIKNQYTNSEPRMRTNLAVMSNENESRATVPPINASRSAVQSQPSSKTSSWEKLLDSIGIPEITCTALIGCRSQKGRALRSWVHEHYRTKFVPENVLEFLGLSYQLKLKWQVEN